MMAIILKWIILIMALVNAGYMTFDGTRALITGDYIRPKTGEYARQLGPWSKLVEKIGIDPMLPLMKSIFIIYGIVGLIITICFLLDISWAWRALLIFNICSLWNLFIGTGSSVLQIILLIIIRAVR